MASSYIPSWLVRDCLATACLILGHFLILVHVAFPRAKVFGQIAGIFMFFAAIWVLQYSLINFFVLFVIAAFISLASIAIISPRFRANLAAICGGFSRRHGQYQIADWFHTKALAIREKAFGHDHPDIIPSLVALVNLHLEMYQLDRAESYLKCALEIPMPVVEGNGKQDSIVKRHNVNYALALNMQSSLLLKRGRFMEAQASSQRALLVFESSRAQENVHYALALNGLSVSYIGLGKYRKAKKVSDHALEMVRKQPKPMRSWSLPMVMLSQVSIHFVLRKYSEAESLGNQALSLAKEANPKNQPTILAAMDILAKIYLALNDPQEAEPLCRRGLKLVEKWLPREHPLRAEILNTGAMAELAMNGTLKAEEMARESLTIRIKAQGSGHPTVAESYHTLAQVAYKQGDYPAAERFYQQSLTIRQTALGKDHPLTGKLLKDYAVLLNAMKKTEAHIMEAEALAIEGKVLQEGL
jgi:tetratricopeptide (TPR) repeat protein